MHCLNGPLRLGSHEKVDKRATIDPSESESGPRLNTGWELMTKRLPTECRTVWGPDHARHFAMFISRRQMMSLAGKEFLVFGGNGCKYDKAYFNLSQSVSLCHKIKTAYNQCSYSALETSKLAICVQCCGNIKLIIIRL